MEVAYSEALRDIRGDPSPHCTICPPNRLETRTWDLLAPLLELGNSDSLSALADFLRRFTGRKHIFFAPSCRAAIAQILSLLPQKEVVMPVFTCPVVGAAVEIAGKRAIYVDSAPHQVNSTSAEFAEHARRGRILLPTHLFGIPTDVENVCELGRNQGCITIEDAAAALGTQHNGRPLGTFADFGVFSFERSKRFPAFRGAAIVVNNDKILEPSTLSDGRWISEKHSLPSRDLAFALAYNIATIPWLYGRLVLPRLLRHYASWSGGSDARAADDFLHSPFYTRKFHPLQAALVLRMLNRFDRIREQIRYLVATYVETLRNTSVVTFLPNHYDAAGLLRFPIAVPRLHRPRFLQLALERGIFLETNYENLLAEPAANRDFPNASWISRNMVLLPLYTALSVRNARALAEAVATIAEQS